MTQPGPYGPAPGGGGCGAESPFTMCTTAKFSCVGTISDSPPIDEALPPSLQWYAWLGEARL